MARATTKKDLLSMNSDEYDALEKWLAGLNPTQLTQPGVLGSWSVKDTLAHLHEWHQMVKFWYAAGLRGENPPTPTADYNWGQLPALNQHIYETYRNEPLEVILTKFRTSHQKTQELILSLSEQDLFTPGLYPWMRKNCLAAYFSSNCSSHYRWARTELRKGLKKLIAQAESPLEDNKTGERQA